MSVSQENIELLLEANQRFESTDWDGLARLWHPDARLSGPEGWPEPGPFEGREAVIEQFRRLASDWQQQQVADVEVVVDRDEWVVWTLRWETRGGKSGAATEGRFAAAYRVTDGLINEAHFRWTPEEALAAAGLSE